MSRIHALVHQPRLALSGLVTVALASAAVIGSGADFTASSASAASTFTTGHVRLDNSKENVAIFNATNLRPNGQSQSGTVDIKNTGDYAETIKVTRGTVTDDTPALAPKLNVVIKDCGLVASADCSTGTVKYADTLDNMGTVDLSSYAVNESRRYQFSVSLDSSADNTYQGKTAKTPFTFDAS
jgi:spore coat-associated protein N